MADMTEDRQGEMQSGTGQRNPLNVLAMIGSAIGGTLTLNDILDRALDATLASLEMDAGEIFLLDTVRGEVSKVRHRGQVPEVFAERTCFVVGEGIPGCVVQSTESIIISDLASDRRFLRPQVVAAGFRTFAAIPLRAKGKIIGCFTVAGRRPHILTEDDLDLLNAVGATIGLAVANGHLYEDLWLATKQLETKVKELEQTQAVLVATERLRAMGQLAAGIAHDFNNALTAILGQALVVRLGLQQGTVSKDRLFEHLRLQEQAVLDAAETVRRIRVATYPRGGEPFAAVAINETIMDVTEVTRPRWKDESHARGIEIDLRTDLTEVPPVFGRAAELREALINLLFNAVDAIPRCGTIMMTTRAVRAPEGELVEITVRDSGIGMPKSVQERLFEPFFTTKGNKGTGLGLSMVYGIISRHGGTIDVASVPGEGTAATIRLPTSSGPAKPDQCRIVSRSVPVSLRVLVIDDVPSIAETLSQILYAHGQEAEAVTGGKEGLARLEEGRFDLVITDLSMPGMSGWNVASAVKARWPELPVILITGWLDVVGDDEQTAGMADLILTKPFTSEQLLHAIAQVCAGREVTRPSSNKHGGEHIAVSRQNT